MANHDCLMTELDQALTHHQAGRLQDAEALYRKVLDAQPGHADALHGLGLLALQRGYASEAITLIEQALHLKPRWAEAHSNLGLALQAQGDLKQAVVAYRQALTINPALGAAQTNLGLVLLEQNKAAEALVTLQQAAQINPSSADAHYNLGNAFAALNNMDAAIAAYERALALQPQHAEAYNNLGLSLQAQHRYVEAQTALERALGPKDPEPYNNLGAILVSQGRHQAGIERFRQALAMAPDYADAQSNVFQAMHYTPAFDAAAIYSEAHLWAAQHANPLAEHVRSHANDRTAQRRLRLGYVSADLRRHPVGAFFVPVFAHHDKRSFELYCYAGVRKPDDLTARFRVCADHWHEVASLDDAALAKQVRADKIDILIDLSGHTLGHRLLTFARKPAPVQVTAGGHYNTTGMTAIDYLISDRFHTPPGAARYFSETLIRMPNDYICYGPPECAPAVSAPPFARHGFITFGCFNNLAKVNEQVIALWAKVLQALPKARLKLQTRALNDASTRERYRTLFIAHGIETARLDLQGYVPHSALLAAYGDIDIALDPFPYSGGLTTCEALWMGVPVITLTGETFAARHSTSHLSNVGLPELVTATAEDYVATATALAQDSGRLTTLRQGLREQMAASPLCDAARYTRDLEAAYRGMWIKYCDMASN